MREIYLYDDDVAFAYPSLATNGRGEVGISFSYASKDYSASQGVGIIREYTDVIEIKGTSLGGTGGGQGDYNTIRRYYGAADEFGYPVGNCFSVAGFAQGPVKGKLTNHPHYILFGRKGDDCGVPAAPGLPLRDSDHDGVPDTSDACPNVVGTQPNGCPAAPPPDSDHDGVPDDRDTCPHKAGTLANGCPAPPPGHADLLIVAISDTGSRSRTRATWRPARSPSPSPLPGAPYERSASPALPRGRRPVPLSRASSGRAP